MTRFTVAASGRCALNAATAWFTSATRSARNSTRLAQLAFISRSTSAITVRVLPEPVAITSSALRCLSASKLWATLRDGAALVVALDDRLADVSGRAFRHQRLRALDLG